MNNKYKSTSDLSSLEEDNNLVNSYFSFLNLTEEQICILKYIHDNPLPDISDNIDLVMNYKIFDKIANRNKKLVKQALDEDYHVLSLGQQNEFLKFLYNFTKVNGNHNMSFANIEYYIKAFNNCTKLNFPIIQMSDLYKDSNKTTLILIREYNRLLEKTKTNFNNRRNAITKGILPDYLALSKLRNKYKFYNEV